jgi:hypothetical protein
VNEGKTEGFEVSCMETNILPDEWQIIGTIYPYDLAPFTNDPNFLCCDEPFFIKHTPTGYYLAQTYLPAKCYKYQAETLLVNRPQLIALWTVECV